MGKNGMSSDMEVTVYNCTKTKLIIEGFKRMGGNETWIHVPLTGKFWVAIVDPVFRGIEKK